MDHKQLAAVVAYFGAAFPNFDPSDDTLDVWWNELQDIDGDIAYQAMRNLVRHSEFPPTIARFRAECSTIAQHRRLANASAAGLPPATVGAFPKELVDDLKAMLKEKSAQLHGRSVIRRRSGGTA